MSAFMSSFSLSFSITLTTTIETTVIDGISVMLANPIRSHTYASDCGLDCITEAPNCGDRRPLAVEALPVLLRTSIAQAGLPGAAAVHPCALPSLPLPLASGGAHRTHVTELPQDTQPAAWQARGQEEFMRLQWEELQRSLRKRKRDEHFVADESSDSASATTTTQTSATGFGGGLLGRRPITDELFERRPTTDYWWSRLSGAGDGGTRRDIPRNPAPLALEHVMPFLADYDFTTTPLVVTTLHQAFIAFRIWEPRRVQDLRLPNVVHTSSSYAALSQFSTDEEVGRTAHSIRPDLENMSLLVAHLLIEPADASNVGPVFRCLCYVSQKGGGSMQVSCSVQNLYSRRGLVKWQIMVVDGVVGRAATLPPYMSTMQTDDLMGDYLQSRVAHYINLLLGTASPSTSPHAPSSSVRATIDHHHQHHHRAHSMDVYAVGHLLGTADQPTSSFRATPTSARAN
ncbi:uncharacterized protein ACA1_376520 [Acanthamoeba castellanii str. Neff]|uniref:START domain-containing protein n=1 Tax=Acanthamoeba castellanii (strain ATCC 30010 / Neff) TaxID=1257118 RepID=L8HF98_ACACF|nr:uncharacterized protein ACA1_376520 [Acanthamoeba castellanii str. Neff]ELR24179.1 hypothetical protein ACA1_376520 [Acanthamoeba castellanii str. Neff]